MNYERVYNQIIERGKQRLLEGYGENHHIVPRCMGGADTQDNIVRLTAREHFICHWLLTRIHPDSGKLSRAAFLMSYSRKGIKVSSRTYQELKEGLECTEETRGRMSKVRKGRPMSTTTKKILREINIGNTYRLGKAHTEETKLKMSQSAKGRSPHNKGKSKLEKYTLPIAKAYTEDKQSAASLAREYSTDPLTMSRFLKNKGIHKPNGRGRVNKI